MFKNRKAWITIELVVTMTLLMAIIISFAVVTSIMGRANNILMTRQRCIAAAQAQIDSIAAVGKPISREDFQRLWPNITVAVIRSHGTDQWESLELIQVTVISEQTRKPTKVSLRRYIKPSQEKDS